MIVWKNKKTGHLYPEMGADITLDPTPTRMKIFEKGKGRRSEPISNWTQDEIPDLRKGYTLKEYRDYFAKYGKECAMHFLDCCDMMKDGQARLLADPAYPDEDLVRWCVATFGLDPRSLCDPLVASFGTYQMDVLGLETHLQTKGYNPDSPGSMLDFMAKTWGEPAAARFTNQFFPLSSLRVKAACAQAGLPT